MRFFTRLLFCGLLLACALPSNGQLQHRHNPYAYLDKPMFGPVAGVYRFADGTVMENVVAYHPGETPYLHVVTAEREYWYSPLEVTAFTIGARQFVSTGGFDIVVGNYLKGGKGHWFVRRDFAEVVDMDGPLELLLFYSRMLVDNRGTIFATSGATASPFGIASLGGGTNKFMAEDRTYLLHERGSEAAPLPLTSKKMMHETLVHLFSDRSDLLAYLEHHAVTPETLPGLVRAFNSGQKFILAD